ncbi:MAG TPA: NAD kinase [Alphaproteobacteria bacterium]
MKVAILASEKRDHSVELAALRKQLTEVAPQEADVIVTLGGDGFLLRMLHQHVHLGKPFYGLNRGTHGFLLNDYESEDILDAIKDAEEKSVHPLRMTATTHGGKKSEAIAFNEVTLVRTGVQAAKIKISVDGEMRLEKLVGDGVLVSTPMGSTAYNQSAHGPILPLDAGLLALTPICPFRPRRWDGALLPDHSTITFDVYDSDRRPVHAIADFTSVENVENLDVSLDRSVSATLLFAPESSLDDRIRDEQFKF